MFWFAPAFPAGCYRLAFNMTARDWILYSVLAFQALPCCTQELSPDVLKMAQAMNTNRDLLKRLQLYTCLETMERTSPRERGRGKMHDVVQVDVGAGEGHELYSWPDESSFSPLDVGDLIGHGMLSNGMFEGFAHDVFLGSAVARFTVEEIMQGTKALHFSYHVPSLGNDWRINWQGKRGELGQAGEFWVDAVDFHLLRLKVVAQDIPPQMLLHSLILTVDYQLSGSGDALTLVPSSSELTVVDTRGKIYRNEVAFSHCQVFHAESRVSTDEEAAAAFTQHKKEQGSLPAGLNLKIELAQPVVARTAHVGDEVQATLASDIKLNGGVTVPEGSLLKGRIRRFENIDDPPNTYLVGIEFSDLEVRGRSYRFLAELEDQEALQGISTELSKTSETWMNSGIAGTSMTTERLIGTAIPGAAVFFLSNTAVLPKGFRMTWRTKEFERVSEARNPR